MHLYIKNRVMDISNYMIDTNTTIRQIADIFGVSRSTVHTDLTKRLELISRNEARKVYEILQEHKKERHLRGGEATKQKYLKMR